MSLQTEIRNLEQSIARLEQALTIATTPPDELPYEPASSEALDFVRSRLATQSSDAQRQNEVAALQADLNSSKDVLAAKQKKLTEIEQRVSRGRKAIAAKAESINDLATQLEQAIADLKREVATVEGDWESCYGSAPLQRLVGADSGLIPTVTEQESSFLLGSKRIYW